MEKNLSLNVSLVSNELKLIFEIIKNDDFESILINFDDELREIDWTLFHELVMHHRVFPLVFKKLKNINSPLIPINVIKKLSVIYKKNTFRMLDLTREMVEVCDYFHNHQIQLLVLKGPSLGEDLYGDISLRTSGDLDVLVQIDELNKVEDLLSKIGYIKDDYIQTVLNDWKWRHHHITFFHSEKKIKLEIHWRLNPGPGKEPRFQELWERKRESSLSNPVYYLGREDLFLFLVSHGARHGWSRLRWLVDIDQMTKQKMNWEFIITLLKKYHYLNVGGQALVLSSGLLGTYLTEKMQILINGKNPPKLAQDAIFYLERMVNLHTIPVPEEIATFHKRHLFLLMSRKQKLLYIMSFMYPYPEDAKTLPLPKQLHVLYFPLRPFLWLWRKTRRHSLSSGEL